MVRVAPILALSLSVYLCAELAFYALQVSSRCRRTLSKASLLALTSERLPQDLH
ncbi:hypothetical protein MRX96_025436 [Rhipicephalus microplus]